jgi:hypothetical protein
MECGAQKRGGKGICKARAMENGRCRIHGGKSLVGVASGQFVHGRHSKYLPVRLASTYAASIADPDLLAMRSELALLDSRLSDVLEGIGNSESGELWKRLKEAMREHDKAKEGDKAEAFGRIRWLINEGYQEYMSWMEVRHIIEDRRRVADSERGRLKDLQQMITAERAMVFVSAVVDAVRRHVDDRDVLAAISNDLRAFAVPQGGG